MQPKGLARNPMDTSKLALFVPAQTGVGVETASRSTQIQKASVGSRAKYTPQMGFLRDCWSSAALMRLFRVGKRGALHGSCPWRLTWHAQERTVESQSKPGIISGLPRTMKIIRKAAATVSGWIFPLLTFTYPGFDCDSVQGCPKSQL